MKTLRHRAGGFSLLELLVAIAIGLIMLALLAVLFSNSSASRMELERVTRLMENSRFAIDAIGDDARHAGYLGPVALPSTTSFVQPSPCETAVGNLGFDVVASPIQAPGPLLGINQPNAGFSTPSLACLSNRVTSGPDVLVIRRVSAQPLPSISASSVVGSNLYLQASQCAVDPGIGFKVSNNAADFDLRTVKCLAGPANLAPARRYFVRAYYLASCNVCSPTPDNVPTLKRVELIDGNLTTIALAEGVINMQFEYGFDTDGDGTPDEFRADTAAAIGTPPPANSQWQNVVTIRAHLLVRSVENSNVLDGATRTFDLGPGANALQCPAGFRCRLVTTTFRLNNVAGRRES